MTDITRLTASETADEVAGGRLSSREVVEALLARIDQTEPDLQAWEVIDREGARARADEADAARPREGPRGSLDGVVVGVKDVIDVAGMPTGAGFAPFRERIARRDAEVVSRLRRDGAIILGKVSTAQFAVSDPPRTRSPWDPDLTPGGSSTGSGVAVAAGHVPIALGTQTGGSLLRPAAYNGVVGYKPTFEAVPTSGVLPLAWSLDHVGPITRSVDDCALFMSAASGTSFPRPATPNASPPRLGIIEEALARCEPEIEAGVVAAVDRLEAAGAVTTRITLEQPLAVLDATYRVIMQTEAAAAHAELLQSHREHYDPLLLAYLEVGRLLPGWAYVKAQRHRLRLADVIASALTGVDALLLPVVPQPPPPRERTGSSAFLSPFSLVGAPAIALPSRLSGGLPQAIQLVAGRGEDGQLLRCAGWCATALGPVDPPPLLPR